MLGGASEDDGLDRRVLMGRKAVEQDSRPFEFALCWGFVRTKVAEVGTMRGRGTVEKLSLTV